MAKIARQNMKIFASGAGANQIGKFGSLAAGSPAYAVTPEQVQELANYITGWYGGIVLGSAPAIQDMNALCYLYAYQIAYALQSGIPDWNAATDYWIGDIVKTEGGGFFRSITDNSVNRNPESNTAATYWEFANTPAGVMVSQANGTYNLNKFRSGLTYFVDSSVISGGNLALALPNFAPPQGFEFYVKDIGGAVTASNLQVVKPLWATNLNGLAANLALQAPYGTWRFKFDGTNLWTMD